MRADSHRADGAHGHRTAERPPHRPSDQDHRRDGWSTRDTDCACGRVCVCTVPLSMVRSVASFVAEWHPTGVVEPDPFAERAEDATPCRCGQTFCGYRILARNLRRSGAFVRA